MEATDLRDLDAVCAKLKLESVPEVWRRSWAQSAASFAEGGAFFLQEGYIRETCALLGNSPEVEGALQEAAARVLASPVLQRVVWHCHWLMCCSGLDPEVGQWPEVPEDVEAAGPMLWALVVLAGVPHLREMHEARGIGLEVTIDTLSDLETWLQEYHRRHERWNFTRIGWMVHHLRGRLLKLGRLEYLPGSYYHPLRWYRQRGSGKVLALVEDGALLRSDGQFASADGGEVREGLWRARLQETPTSVTGNPVFPWGKALPRTVVLDTKDWHEVLRRGDPVMTVHIPATGPMDPASCGASFRQAVDVYRERYPELRYRAFTCDSWLLDPQFELLEPAPANICAFVREWYLHPTEGAAEGGTLQRLFDLFGSGRVDLETAPQETSLQRAAVAFMREGGHLRGGGGVVFPQDLPWGRQVYRRERCPDGLG